MQVVVFGANGKVGSRVVAQLLERNYTVRAAVHGSHSFRSHKNLEIITCDIYNRNDIERALEGAETVISTLGSWGTPQKNILATAMRNIIPLMEQKNLPRLISLTGADARMDSDKLDSIHRITHPILHLFARKVLHDGEEHMRLLAKSELSWTVIRSPIMSDRGGSSYTLTNRRPYPWQTINRDSVAIALVDQLESSGWSKKAPFICR